MIVKDKSSQVPGGFTKDGTLLCLAWIGAVLLLGGVLGFCTGSYRSALLAGAVNKGFLHSGSRRIEISPVNGNRTGPAALGNWFAVNGSDERAFVFTMTRNGVFAACMALTGSGGAVRAILPLSGNAEQITEELPLPVYRFYAERIERAAGTGGRR